MQAWRKVMAAYRRVYDSRHLQADCKNRDQLRNPTLGSRVWATFTCFSDDDNNHDHVYGAVIMTKVIAREFPGSAGPDTSNPAPRLQGGSKK